MWQKQTNQKKEKLALVDSQLGWVAIYREGSSRLRFSEEKTAFLLTPDQKLQSETL